MSQTVTEQIEAAASSASGEESAGTLPVRFDVARNIDDVLGAWRLVHQAYTRAGLIDPNPQQIHTMPQAIGSQAGVILGRLGDAVTSTMTGYADSALGLPLDSVYRRELDALRAAGRRLVEVGLFADRREALDRKTSALMELMRYIFFFAWNYPADDIVVGVHPHHTKFYKLCFAFETIGEEKSYATVKDNPVVFMRLDMHAKMQLPRLPRGLAYFSQSPLGAEVFRGRFSVPTGHPIIDGYFQEKSKPGQDLNSRAPAESGQHRLCA